MRGYFGVGIEGISKSYNLGAILRTSNAFGASFAFTIGATNRALEIKRTDTSKSENHMPFYEWDNPENLVIPKNSSNLCILIWSFTKWVTFFKSKGESIVIGGKF